jgi:hypothetical protein
MTTPVPNSRDVTAMSRGISRNMALDGSLLAAINAFNGPTGRFYVDPGSFEAIPRGQGGGDLNGSTGPMLFGQAGTAGRAIGVPRNVGSAVNRFAGQPLAGALPVNTTTPFLYQQFDALIATVGIWSNVPTWYNFQWRRDGVPIPGGVPTPDTLGSSLGVTATDNGHSFDCIVIAVNGFGTGLPVVSNAAIVAGVA